MNHFVLSHLKNSLLFGGVVLLMLTGCNLPGSAVEIPATPTTAVVIPMVTVAVDEETDEAEVEVKATPTETPTETPAEPTDMPKEVVEEATEDVDEAAPEATKEITPTVAEQTAVTPTAIPTNDSQNPDPTIYFVATTTCYISPDTTSSVSGVAYAGTALGAIQRKGNFYRVNHPSQDGWLCWVTGSGISPNAAAFDLEN